jgi:formyltetrahydrofolate-dependent phosphoribosylglycinamide formyltransferase
LTKVHAPKSGSYSECESKIAVLVSGNGSNLQALLDSDVRPHISLVVSNRQGAKALVRAAEAGCPSRIISKSDYVCRDQFDRALAELLNEHGVTLVVLAGWMHILGDEYLRRSPRTINLHPALPGCYPGVNAIERAWQDRVEESGCMVHEVIAEVDAGRVLGVEKIKLSTFDDLEAYKAAVHRAEHRLLLKIVQEILTSGQGDIESLSGAPRPLIYDRLSNR